jgi:hypothetical protein
MVAVQLFGQSGVSRRPSRDLLEAPAVHILLYQAPFCSVPFGCRHHHDAWQVLADDGRRRRHLTGSLAPLSAEVALTTKHLISLSERPSRRHRQSHAPSTEESALTRLRNFVLLIHQVVTTSPPRATPSRGVPWIRRVVTQVVGAYIGALHPCNTLSLKESPE